MARQEPRQSVSRAAIILYASKRLPCRLADVSRTGAMLLVKNPEGLPKSFDVEDSFSGKRRRADLVWIDGKKIGIRFQSAAALVPDRIALTFGRRQA